jgi:hypothetical protein
LPAELHSELLPQDLERLEGDDVGVLGDGLLVERVDLGGLGRLPCRAAFLPSSNMSAS